MIISNSHKFIFVHILKTAGTSACAALNPLLRWNDVILGGTEFGERMNAPYRQRFGLRKHSTAREIRAVVGDDLWSAYFTFTIVRHPYTRMVSFYRWLEQSVRNADRDAAVWSWPATKAFTESGTFSDFIRNETFLQATASRPQVAWLWDEAGGCIVDYIGRFEDLASTRAALAARIGVDLPPFERHNRSDDGRPLADFFAGEADYDYLHELHRQDFEQFGYDPAVRFPPSTTRARATPCD